MRDVISDDPLALLREMIADDMRPVETHHLREFAARIESDARRIRELTGALADANSLCRSAYAIAEREGDANWTAFRIRLRESLDRQHAALAAPDNAAVPTRGEG